MSKVTATVLSLVFILVARPARTQQPAVDPAHLGFYFPLLTSPDIHKELKLTEDQSKKVTGLVQTITDKYVPEFRQVRDLDQAERRRKSQELNRKRAEETGKGLLEILKPDQLKRLDQLGVQLQEVGAFLDPYIQNALKLTDDQKDKLKAVHSDFAKRVNELQRSGLRREDLLQAIEAARKESIRKAVDVLNAQQKKTWEELTGEPFKGRWIGPRPRTSLPGR